MGKARLGQRGRLFKSLFGEEFEPHSVLIVAIDTSKTSQKLEYLITSLNRLEIPSFLLRMTEVSTKSRGQDDLRLFRV